MVALEFAYPPKGALEMPSTKRRVEEKFAALAEDRCQQLTSTFGQSSSLER